MNKIERVAVGVAGVWLVLAIIALALMSPARAAEIPSSASGVYVTPDRVCRLQLTRLGQDHANVDLLCITDAGLPTWSNSTAFAFGGACIGSPGVAYAFPFSGQDPGAGTVAFDALDSGGLRVRVGPDLAALYSGGGLPQTWLLVRPVTSPAPYTCGRQAPRLRVFGP